jgi:hypothetical protein
MYERDFVELHPLFRKEFAFSRYLLLFGTRSYYPGFRTAIYKVLVDALMSGECST